MGKHDVIHKTGSTQRIVTLPVEDRDTATGNIYTDNLAKFGCVVPKISVRTDRQTDTHVCSSQYSAPVPRQSI